MRVMRDQLTQQTEEYERLKAYQAQLEAKAKAEEEAAGTLGVPGRYSGTMSDDIARALAKKLAAAAELI